MPQVRQCKHVHCHTLVEQPDLFCDKHKQYEAEYRARRETYSRTHYNKRVRNRSEEKREQYRFYRSATWSALRLKALERDSYCCQYCKALDIVTANSKIGDHVTPVEIAPELRTDLENIATACKKCDNIKRTLEQQIYGTGQGRTHKNVTLRMTIAEWARLIQNFKDERESP